MTEPKVVAAPTKGPGRWTTVFVTVSCTLMPLFIAGFVAFGQLSERIAVAQRDIVALQLADTRFTERLGEKVSRDEMREFIAQLNQRLVDLRADFRVYYGRRVSP